MEMTLASRVGGCSAMSRGKEEPRVYQGRGGGKASALVEMNGLGGVGEEFGRGSKQKGCDGESTVNFRNLILYIRGVSRTLGRGVWHDEISQFGKSICHGVWVGTVVDLELPLTHSSFLYSQSS